ncbi:hypothetical protein BJ912DRAFT_875616 [Pholiota molesta]|nr:hypothetical protein BJ912DRAFT_875616 [Pholiota molesta]
MASNEKKATDDQIDTEKNNLSASVSDQPLLKALQDFIVPLIRSMDRREEKENNINQFPLGSEAEKLITALREFISSIVRSSPSVTTNTIEVSLIEAIQADLNDGEEDSEEVNDNDGDGDDEAKTSSFEGDPPPKTPSKVENAVTGNLAEKTVL